MTPNRILATPATGQQVCSVCAAGIYAAPTVSGLLATALEATPLVLLKGHSTVHTETDTHPHHPIPPPILLQSTCTPQEHTEEQGDPQPLAPPPLGIPPKDISV
jgi:hypothetical protein